jgi:hypothetical protein
MVVQLGESGWTVTAPSDGMAFTAKRRDVPVSLFVSTTSGGLEAEVDVDEFCW